MTEGIATGGMSRLDASATRVLSIGEEALGSFGQPLGLEQVAVRLEGKDFAAGGRKHDRLCVAIGKWRSSLSNTSTLSIGRYHFTSHELLNAHQEVGGLYHAA